MIIGFFLQIGLTFLTFILGLLPVIPVPVALVNSFTLLWGYVTALSWLLPVSTLLTVLAIAITFHISMILWNFAHLIARYIRGR